MNPSNPGVVLVLSAPTGGGKTTIAHRYIERTPGAAFSVSHTTRNPRPGEREDTDYHFLSRKAFVAMRDRGEFAEWADVHGHLYGTHRGQLERAIREGRDLVLDIDVQGGLQIKAAFPDSVLVFILPPTLDVLLERLSKRRGETGFDLARRLGTALQELEKSEDYDYIILNEDLETAVSDVVLAAGAGRLRSRVAGRARALRGEVEAWLRRRDVQGE
jgi:guanylate kinase